MGDLTENFSYSEFACKCNCGFDRVNRIFAYKLQLARERAGIPFKITSGCRCPDHNANEGGKPTSEHLDGEAADIACESSRDRFKIIEALIEAGFTRIGIAKTFIHVDNDQGKAQQVTWLY